MSVSSAALCLGAKPVLDNGCSLPEVSPSPRMIKVLNIVIIVLHQTHQNYCHKSNTVLPAQRKIWRENLYCVTPLLSGKGYWDMQTWMWDRILFELPPKTTKNKLNSKSCKSEGRTALLNLFTNHPAAIKHRFCHLFTVCVEKAQNKSKTSHNLCYLGLY